MAYEFEVERYMRDSDRHFYDLASAHGSALVELCARSAAARDESWGETLTFSPKVFLPLTNICRNRCSYCTFRRSPGEQGAYTMTSEDVRRVLTDAAANDCTEALFCLGDTPEKAFSAYRKDLASIGHDSTVSYLRRSGEVALELDVLPHTNAGILTREEMAQLRPVNVSLGLMLESTSERLCAPGGPHYKAPDKQPEVRLRMTREAGELQIPFTSGILIGIGETPEERVDTLIAIRDLHREFGHIQEVIVQNFRAKDSTPMAGCAEPTPEDMMRTIALARLIMPPDVSVQAPPNLNPASISQLIAAGINDFGGISPLTPDFINPEHPWPHLGNLAEICRARGFTLSPRLPIYPRYMKDPRFIDSNLVDVVSRANAQLQRSTRFDFLSESGEAHIELPVRASSRMFPNLDEVALERSSQ